MSYNCPVCSKAGLPDYTKTQVVCPQCGSDLQAFLLLRAISRPRKYQIVKYLTLGVSLITIIFFGLLLKSNYDKDKLISKNLVLNDSIVQLSSTNQLLKEKYHHPITEKKEVVFYYVVKKGDNPYKLARLFYNKGSKYKQIESDNNLVPPYILKAGQTLIIKLTTE